MINYSLTYVGAIVVVLSTLASSLGLNIGNQEITITVITTLQFFGSFIALIGRWQAGGVNWFGVKK